MNHKKPALCFNMVLPEGPGVARGKKKFEEKNFRIFLSLKHPPATHECPQKMSTQSVQPFGRL